MQNKHKQFIRKTRKDGSCFYRCFIFRLFENLIADKQYFQKFMLFEKINKAHKLMKDSGYETLVFEDFEDNFKDMLSKIQ